MERIRVAGIIPIGDGFALIHRVGVIKRKDIQEYYTFPGGGVEEGETLQEAIIREIKEELGITIKVVKKLYEMQSEKFHQQEIFYLCEYKEGTFGTGTGPEFSNDPKYKESGAYIPEIISKKEVGNILLLPTQIRDKFWEDIKHNKIG